MRIDPAVTLWSSDDPDRAARPLLVLLHGYGADERDLFGLVTYLPEGFVVAAVGAPLRPPRPAPGRSWYAIEGLDGRRPDEVTDAAASVLSWLDEHAAGHPSVGLLGFSQGAAVSLQAMRLDPSRLDVVVALSGYAVPGALPGDDELRRLRPPVFWGRGDRDDVIPPFLVDATAEWLPEHTTLSGRVYPGLTHSISEAELADIRDFLQARLPEPTA